MTLEELLIGAAAKGLTHLTLYPVESGDRKTTYWLARATPSTGHQYVSVVGIDPVKALTEVLEGLPRAKKRQKNPDPNLYGSMDVTATVKRPPIEPINMDESAERLAEIDAAEPWMLKP